MLTADSMCPGSFGPSLSSKRLPEISRATSCFIFRTALFVCVRVMGAIYWRNSGTERRGVRAETRQCSPRVNWYAARTCASVGRQARKHARTHTRQGQNTPNTTHNTTRIAYTHQTHNTHALNTQNNNKKTKARLLPRKPIAATRWVLWIMPWLFSSEANARRELYTHRHVIRGRIQGRRERRGKGRGEGVYMRMYVLYVLYVLRYVYM